MCCAEVQSISSRLLLRLQDAFAHSETGGEGGLGANSGLEGPAGLLARSLSADPDLNPETTSMLNLLSAWCIGLLIAVEGSRSAVGEIERFQSHPVFCVKCCRNFVSAFLAWLRGVSWG